MPKKIIVQTDLAPKPIGPYSQAVKSGGFMFCSGQITLDPKTNEFVGTGDVKKQARQVLDNIKFLLSHEKLNLTDIVKTTIFLKNMSDFPHVNEIYGEYFTSNFPARSTIARNSTTPSTPSSRCWTRRTTRSTRSSAQSR